MHEFKYLELNGPESRKYLDQIAALRIEVFKGFPYLYEGQFEYEAEYLETYFECKDARLMICFNESGELVACTVCIPLQFEMEKIQKPFLERGIDISKFFYIGEQMILPGYRGSGIWKKFWRFTEKSARELGMDSLVAMTVVRDDDHSSKPDNYKITSKSISKFLGFKKVPGIIVNIPWPMVGTGEMEDNLLEFWIKPLKK